MITDGDVGNILYTIMKTFGLPVHQGGNQKDYSSVDRVVIHTHKLEKESHYMKCFAEVNVIVSDEGNEAKTSALKQYEKKLMEKFYDGQVYEHQNHAVLIEYSSLGVEEDSQLKSHFVNCKLLISILR